MKAKQRMQRYCSCGQRYICFDPAEDGGGEGEGEATWECEDEGCEEPLPLCAGGTVVVRTCQHEGCDVVFRPLCASQHHCAEHKKKERSSLSMFTKKLSRKSGSSQRN